MAKDYFSTQSDDYKAHRPSYPDALYANLTNDLGSDIVVWDCATGNGQAALGCLRYAGLIVASDQSAAQITNATHDRRIHYIQARAEQMPLASRSIDLIMVAQALHWFDFDPFYAEARRLLKPGGRIAAWTYSFLAVAPQLGQSLATIVRWFYHDVVGRYWPAERRWVDEAYRTIPFPFTEAAAPNLAIEVDWDLADVLGYIGSWSAVQQYIKAEMHDPLPILRERMVPAWGEPQIRRKLKWNLGIRIGQR